MSHQSPVCTPKAFCYTFRLCLKQLWKKANKQNCANPIIDNHLSFFLSFLFNMNDTFFYKDAKQKLEEQMNRMISCDKDLKKVEPRSRSVGAESRSVGSRYFHSRFFTCNWSIVEQRKQVKDIHSEESGHWRILTRILQLYGKSCKSWTSYQRVKASCQQIKWYQGNHKSHVYQCVISL